MAHRHVALLRGINVGRAKRVAMADLRELFERLGYGNVQTLLNSGNVVFGGVTGASNAIGARIETALTARLGVDARVTVLSAAELTAIVEQNPFGEIMDDPSHLLVAFLNATADHERLASLAQADWAPEAFVFGPRAAYLWCPGGILAGRIWPAFDRISRGAATSRNWTTVKKLQALACAEPAR